MKRKLLFLFIAILPLSALAQEGIPKRSSKIFIETNLTDEENFNKVTKFLIEEAIDIETRDKELGLITTSVFKRGKAKAIALTFFMTHGTVRITGKFKSGMDLDFGGVIAKDDFQKIENRGMKGSIFHNAFSAMNGVASELGTVILYE